MHPSEFYLKDDRDILLLLVMINHLIFKSVFLKPNMRLPMHFLKKYNAVIENRLENKIKFFRTDNGEEFGAKNLINISKKAE